MKAEHIGRAAIFVIHPDNFPDIDVVLDNNTNEHDKNTTPRNGPENNSKGNNFRQNTMAPVKPDPYIFFPAISFTYKWEFV